MPISPPGLSNDFDRREGVFLASSSIYLDIAIDIVPDDLRPKSCDHQGKGYIGTFLSKELSLVTWPKCT